MILIFNKQYRQESGLISDLTTKIKKSKQIIQEYNGNKEIYKLDSIDIILDVLQNTLVVMDKNKNVIVDMNCQFDRDELQEARYYMFSNLLEAARKTYKKRTEKVKALEQAAQKIKAEQARIDKAKAEKLAADAKIADARRRLKSL